MVVILIKCFGYFCTRSCDNIYFGKTLLAQAILKKNNNAVQFLLDHGANPNAQIYKGETALHIAVKMGNIAIIHLLLQNGADISIKNSEFILGTIIRLLLIMLLAKKLSTPFILILNKQL